jgi:hypothetical protein
MKREHAEEAAFSKEEENLSGKSWRQLNTGIIHQFLISFWPEN